VSKRGKWLLVIEKQTLGCIAELSYYLKATHKKGPLIESAGACRSGLVACFAGHPCGASSLRSFVLIA